MGKEFTGIWRKAVEVTLCRVRPGVEGLSQVGTQGPGGQTGCTAECRDRNKADTRRMENWGQRVVDIEKIKGRIWGGWQDPRV